MQKIIDYFIKQNHQTELTKLYRAIPVGVCSECSKCCYDNVPLSAVEFVSILYVLGNRILDFQSKVKAWYLNQYNKVQPCIFLHNGQCQIYDVRPSTCRLFGHQSKDEQLARIKFVREQKLSGAKWLYYNYQIKVDLSVIEHVIEPCDFKPERSFTKFQASKIFDALTKLSSGYYLAGFIDEDVINFSLIEWMVLFFYDENALFKTLINNWF